MLAVAHKSSDRLHPYIVGQQVIGRVEKVFPFGVFLRLEDGTRAYLRRRELSLEGDVDPRETISVGETIQAAVLSLGEPGRLMELSVRSLLPDPWDQFTTTFRVRDVVTVVIKQLSPHGAFAQIVPGVDGFIPLGDLALWEVERVEDVVWVGDHVEAMITRIDRNQKRVSLSIRQRMEQLARVETVVARMSRRYLKNGKLSSDHGERPE